MLLGTLGTSLLGNIFRKNGMLRVDYENKERKAIFRAGYGKYFFLLPSHPLIIFKIEKYYQNETRFNAVYSRDNLPKKQRMGHM